MPVCKNEFIFKNQYQNPISFINHYAGAQNVMNSEQIYNLEIKNEMIPQQFLQQ